jgi:hypothetical protein
MFCCPWRFYCPGITWLRLAAWEVAYVIDAAGGTQLGLPAPEVIEELYELRDGHAATMLYLWGLPIVAMAQLQRAHREVLGGGDFDLGAYLSYDDKLGILTPNTVTPYYMAFADLGRTGPLVIDVPAGPIAGGASDFWQQPIVDMGQTGRDRGTGGRYLLVGPDQDAPVAGGCYLGRSRTNNVWVALRLLTTDAAECERILAAFQLYPFADREDAPRTRIVYPDGTRWNQAQPSGLSYFEALAEILGREPVAERDQFFHGIARSLGLQRGTPFAPGDRQRRILTAAAVQGEAIAQANAFHKRFASARYRPGSRWDLVVNIEPDQARDGIGQFFERAAWFYEASGMGEGMAHPAPGLGQAYLGGYTDRDGQWLDGARDYRLVVPPDPPARQFWSVCIYDALTRTIPDNTTKIAEISSRTDPVTNPDGSIELRFGPQPPADTSQSNWIQTIPGRAWFAYLRLYGPTESYFDRSWPLGDIHPA